MNAFPPAPSRLPLLLILVLAPGVGLAAPESAPPPLARHSALSEPPLASSGLPGTDARAALRLRQDDPASQESNAAPSTGLRILAETGAGLLTSLGGGVVGTYVGAGLCEARIVPRSESILPCFTPTAVGLLVGGGAAFALGVWWGGELAGGDGKLLGALGGFAVGAALGTGLALATQEPSVGLILGIPLSLLGSFVGYESTQREPAPGARAPSVASARARLQPVLAFSPRGTLVGMSGTF